VTDLSMGQRLDLTGTPAVAFIVRPIGLVHTVPRKRVRTPTYFVPKGRATLELFHPYFPGLQGLYGGLDLWVITYHAPSWEGPTEPGQTWDGTPGIFATTSVERPNPIEFLRARIVDLSPEKGLLHVVGLDVEDGAPILDIRPAASPHRRLAKPGEYRAPA